ncbi:hypothetical protein OXH62_28335 [Pseudomonas chlororaphis]|uniref:hypothetical protein n=1 Tax=Pseudomonas chlororaphis TaxID=587753 RepID=UPI0035D3E97A
MQTPNLTAKQESIIHNCLLDLLESHSLNNPSFLSKALDSLIESRGFGIEMSGIYISTDDDYENIPEYLKTGIAFEFMDDHVSLPFGEAIACITNWCNKNNQTANASINSKLKALQKKFMRAL